MQRKIKWIFTVVAVLLFIIFGSMVPNDGLKGRAMVVGMGFDVADNGEYVITVQILTSNNNQTVGSGTRVVQGQGKTISEATNILSEKCGRTLTVTHCNVLIIGGKNINRENLYYILYIMSENSYVSDNAYIFFSEDNAYEILKQKTGFGDDASLYLQNTISMYGGYNNIAYRTLTQCLVGYWDLSSVMWLPCLTPVDILSEVPSSNEYETVEKTSDKVFDMSKVAIFSKGNFVGVYDENASKSINYMLTKVDKGSETFQLPDRMIGVYVLDNSIKTQYDWTKKTVKAAVSIGVTVKDIGTKIDDYPNMLALEENEIKECQQILKQRMMEFYNTMQAEGIDIFYFQQNFYSKFGKEVKEFNISDVTLDLSVELQVKK